MKVRQININITDIYRKSTQHNKEYMNVFVSYSRKDINIVQPILTALKERGVDVWNDRTQIESGDRFAEEIISNLKNSDYILFFHSANTNDSQWVIREISYAKRIGKRILPIKLDISEYCASLKFELATLLYFQWNPGCNEDCIQHILLTIDADGATCSSATQCDEKELQDAAPTLVTQWERKPRRLRTSKCGCIVAIIIIIIALMAVYFVFFGVCYNMVPRESRQSDENFQIEADSTICDTTACDTAVSFGGHENSEFEESEYTTDQTEEDNIFATIATTFVCTLIFVGLPMFLYNRKRSYVVKLGSNFASDLSIDGKKIAELTAYNMHLEKLKKGYYFVDFQAKDNQEQHLSYNLSVGKNLDNYIFAEISKKETPKYDKSNTIKVFIAGSLKLARERDALRSVISVMYNKWQSHDFRILSYTFEDFSNKFKADGGQQSAYDEFIEKEADWAVFVIDGHIGGITHSEFEKAMAAHKRTGRPNILVLSNKTAEDTEEIKEILDQINEEHQYWTPYTTIQEMKKEFESTLNWDLIEMIKK